MYNFCIIKILIKHTTEGKTQYKNVSNGILDAYTISKTHVTPKCNLAVQPSQDTDQLQHLPCWFATSCCLHNAAF